jgi:hypothetical protein
MYKVKSLTPVRVVHSTASVLHLWRASLLLISFALIPYSLLSQCTPATGTESFENDLGTIATGSATQSGIAECYEFTVFSVTGTSTISSDGEDIKLSNNLFVGYFEIGSSDGSEFKLENFIFLKQSSTYDGDMTIQGYKDGDAVPGAEVTQSVGGFSPQTADLSSNTAFQDIDKIRLLFPNRSPNGVFEIHQVEISDPIDCNSTDTEDPVVTCPPSPAVAAATVNLVQFGGSAGDITYTITNSNGDIVGNGASVVGNTGSEFQLPCGADYNFNVTNFVNCNCAVQGLNLSVNGATVLALGTGNPPIVEQSYPFTVDPCDITIPNGECTIDLTNLNPIGTPSDNCDTDPTVSWELTGATTGSGNGYFNQNGAQPFNAGTTTLTYTVEDNNGNTATCHTVIEVEGSAGPDASFSYSAAAYCANDADPLPTITGEQGGAFSSTAGLSLDANTGEIDVSNSTPATYTVTYTVTGTNCDGTSNVEVTINAADDPGFSYSPDHFCANDNDPTPTVIGLSGGTFSSSSGLSINPSTGEIDVSASTPGVYTVTYMTAGSCPNSATDQVEVLSVPTLEFTNPGDFCIDAGVQTGLSGASPAGGTYSGPGITDNGDGTFDLNPVVAGTGQLDITYTLTTNDGCTVDISTEISIDPACGCLDEETNYFYCYDANETNQVAFEVCGSSGLYPVAKITQGIFANDGDELTIYEGGSGSGTSGSEVFSGSGDVSNQQFVGTTTGQCLIFVINSGASGSCLPEGTTNLPLVVCGSETSVSNAFTALSDLCIDAGAQTGLSGGSPSGGVYSGPGVSDDGNGQTYSFNPTAAGVGTHTLSYTVNNQVLEDDVEVFDLSAVTFDDPTAVCLNDGAVSSLGGGNPMGGEYSGPGVTDNNDGSSFTFDPQEAGVGLHTLTYTYTDGNGCANSTTATIEVLALPNVNFSAPADLCVNAGVLSGLSGGSPAGGTYSGPGVADDGNGQTYSLDPATAGAGVHTITYTYTDNSGCTNTATNQVEVFTLPGLSFTALDDLCIDAGQQNGLGSGTPTGGTYSGTGVSDDGNGETYSFAPSAAGVGVHTITYTFTDGNGCSNTTTDQATVFALPSVSFTAPADLCVDAGVQTSLSGGTPSGGTFSGTGVTDDGNGSTFSFDPSAAGVGMHTITYSYTDANGCTNSAEDQITVFALPNVGFADPGDFCVDAGVQNGLNGGTPSGGVYSGTGVSDDGNGQTFSFDPGQAGTGMHELTYTYTDGNGCSNSQSVTVEVNSTLNVTLTDPDDVCTNEGIQTSLGGGLPVGGVYSGPGVEDDGNGATYSFDPVAAGVGQHTITYEVTSNDGCEGSDMVTIEVFASPKAALENPGDFCLNDGIQTNLSGGTEAGGVYTGPGVTDNNGTFDFDPQTAGAGQHTLTYTITTGDGCSDEASQVFEVYALPTVTLEDFDSRCPNDGLATLGSGLPHGGTYSGDGVSDNSNGTNFEFDPQSAGVGVHTITYTYTSSDGCTVEATASLEVADTGNPEFTLCPGQQEVDMEDGLCYGLVPDLTAIVAATDDCGTPELTQDIQAGTSFGSAHLEEQTVTVTATDGAGKKATCEITLQLMDDQPPVPHCKSGTVNLNAEGTYELTLADLYDASHSSDNCGAVEVTDYEAYNLDCDDANTTLQLDVTVEDEAGNPATCQANISVSDDAALPDQWQSTDLGSANTTGTYSFAPCSSNVPGGGDITISSSSNGNTNLNGDNIAFASQTLCGDILGIQAKITVKSGSGYAGIMMRETLDSDSKQVALFTNNSALVRREVRYNTGAAKDISLISAPYSFYLRLRKQGNLVRQFVSASGNNFSLVGAVSIDLGQCPEVGLALFSNDNTPVDATFSELQIRGEAPQSSPGLPLMNLGSDIPEEAVVYPNPARDQFTLELDQPLSEMAEVAVFNQFGQLVAKWQMGPGEVLSDCSTSHWAPGVYYLHIHTPNHNFAPVKIIKTR